MFVCMDTCMYVCIFCVNCIELHCVGLCWAVLCVLPINCSGIDLMGFGHGDDMCPVCVCALLCSAVVVRCGGET
jgi:hypothetical protein